jgi:hypothetical protein
MVSGFLTSPWLQVLDFAVAPGADRLRGGDGDADLVKADGAFFPDELAKSGFHDHKFRRMGVKKSGGGLELAAR